MGERGRQRHRQERRRRLRGCGRLAAAAATGALALSGCTGGSSSGGPAAAGTTTEATAPATAEAAVRAWVVEVDAARAEASAEVLQAAADAAEVPLEVVAVPSVEEALADGSPDLVVGADLAAVEALRAGGLLDADAAQDVVTALGPGTFRTSALALTDAQGAPLAAPLAVPLDAEPLLLLARRDMLEEAGLPLPVDTATLAAAAAVLEMPQRRGLAVPTAVDDPVTAAAHEHLLLSAGCELLGPDGVPRLDAPACVAGLELVGVAAGTVPRPVPQDALSAPADYLAGRAAMLVAPSSVLDDVAGLDRETLPRCPSCLTDPAFLAASTVVVGQLQAPAGPVQAGTLRTAAVLEGSRSEEAAAVVEALLSEEVYVDWLALQPEARVPVRAGTPEEPALFADAWRGLEAGDGRAAALDEVWPPEALDAVLAAPEALERWGFGEGPEAAAAAVAVADARVLRRAVSGVVTGADSPAAAAAAAQVEALRALPAD